jgi:catechol-2,3-dioxygenase
VRDFNPAGGSTTLGRTMDETAIRWMRPPVVHCVREVRAEVAYDRLPEVQYYYSEILGLPAWPAAEQIPGGWGVGNPQCGLYLQFRHDPTVDPVRRRFTLLAPALAEVAQRLNEHGRPYERYRGLGATDEWLLTADPDGNLIEIRQSQRVY